MKLFKKLLCLVCTMALLFTAVPSVLAEGSPTLYFSTPSLEIGGSQGSCYLKMDYAENVSAMDYIVTYDAENLELVSVNNTGFTNRDDVTVSVNSEEAGVIHVTLLSQNGLSGYGNLNLMYFKAKPTAKAGAYPINVLVNDIYDSNLESVEATTQAGTITVREKSTVVKNVSFSSRVSTSAITVGESVNFTLYANNINGLSAGAFEFSYDETKFKFEELTLAAAMEGVIYDVNSERDGLVKMSFVSEKAIGNYRDLVYIKFSAIGSGSARISFKAKDMYDFGFVPMVGNEPYSTITINKYIPPVDYPDFEILVPETILSDKEFSVQVVLEGKSKVRAGDFVISYDSNKLECLGISGETISGAWLSIDKNFADGKVRFSLMSSVDLNEDTRLVTINFKAKENIESTSTLTATGTGTYDAEFTPITLEYRNPQIVVVRPEYTVNFYDSNSTTLIQTQKVPSGNDAVPPDTDQIRNLDKENHLKFSGWDKDYTSITEDTDFVAVYENEAHTEVAKNAVEPTCTEMGFTEGKYCVVCDEILVAQEVIPANGHIEVVDKAVEQTCTETGLTKGSHCSVCNTVLVAQEIIPANGHTEVTDKAVVPTCTETGLTKGSHCSACGEILVQQNVVPAKGHTIVIEQAVEPTCTETGLTKGSHCLVCSETLVAQEVVPAKGHTESVLRRVEPTCTETGLTEGKKCAVCNVTLVAQEEIPAKGHTVSVISGWEPTCTNTGRTDYKYCTVCWNILAYQEEIPANGHTEVVIAGKEPTCTKTGLTEGKKCAACNVTLVEQEEIPAKGHTYGDWVAYGNNHKKTCICGNQIAKPHTWDEGKVTIEPTYTTAGERTYTCICGATKTEVIDKLEYEYMPGDPTGDGAIDTRDIISIRRYIAGGYGIEIIFAAADINKDGDLDSRDIILLRRYLAGGYNVELK